MVRVEGWRNFWYARPSQSILSTTNAPFIDKFPDVTRCWSKIVTVFVSEFQCPVEYTFECVPVVVPVMVKLVRDCCADLCYGASATMQWLRVPASVLLSVFFKPSGLVSDAALMIST